MVHAEVCAHKIPILETLSSLLSDISTAKSQGSHEHMCHCNHLVTFCMHINRLPAVFATVALSNVGWCIILMHTNAKLDF